MSKRNWYMRAIHLVVALAFLLGLAIMPGLVTAQEPPPDPTLDPPDIAFNVKGSIHKVCIDWTGWNQTDIDRAQIDWWLESGVDLTPSDVTVISPSGINPNGGVYGETIKTKDTIDNVPCIELRSMKRGDIHIFVKITLGAEYEWTLHTEKKWGELNRTELDVYADTSAVDHTHSEDFDGDETGVYFETLKDTVWATFLSFPGPELVDGAIVHWWLVEDDDENQAWVDDLMNYLASSTDGEGNPTGGLDDDHWAAHGKYKASELGGRQPWEYINDWVIGVEDPDGDGAEYVDTDLFWWDSVNVPGDVNNATDTDDWYAWAVTEDGIATATLAVNLDDETGLEPCHTYDVMIVVLVSYPSGSTPQDDPFNGENIVCLEKGKKSFHKGVTPEIEQVKTPQLRWAGEKIVLEKEWPYAPYFEEWDIDMGSFSLHYIDLAFYAAIYSLEEGSIGNLEPISDIAGVSVSVPGASGIYIELDYLGLPAGAQQVICPLGGYYYDFTGEPTEWGGYSDTQAILVSQQSGQADVNVALYEVQVLIQIITGEGEGQSIEVQANGPIMNHGFLVYFLEFEDVVLADMDEGALIDITPWDSLTGLEPEEEDGYVAVQVRGFFDYRYSHLPATLRPEQPIDYNGDGVMDVMLPEGRYVLPDDWWLLAGTEDIDLRPNFDLMDQAHLDTIVSPVDTDLDHDEELGPYDSEVRTTDPPAEAEYPTIGPFSTYQLWSTSDMWITEASVPSSFDDDRNTVVPDGEINWYDAPMPQAVVIFDIVDYSTTLGEVPSLSGLDKGDLEGYGFQWSGVDDKIYQSPYYAVEIPANWQIPVGYNWRSWMRDPSFMYWYIPVWGPYDFWTDLELESIISNTHEDPIDTWDVEVYSDNHGIAGVMVDALDNLGRVTITATAEYPYLLRGKYGPRVSEEIDTIWGPAFVHLDADFEVDPREGDAPLTVEFDPVPWTIGGTAPYTDLHWDFGDGDTEDVSGSWTLATLPSTTHTYTDDGVYTVSLTVTDSTPSPIGPMIDICEKIGYITVGAGVPTITWNLEYGLDADPSAVNIWTYSGVPVILADVDATMPDGLLIWYYGGPVEGWKFYKKGWGASNTLTTLVPGGVFGIVPTASVWDIPQE
jgi:hypothetical protein